MKPRSFYWITGFLFTAVAVVHAIRLALAWVVFVGIWVIPQWVSVAGVLVSGSLAFIAFKLALRKAV